MNILADSTLPCLVTSFPCPFTLNTYSNLEELRDKLPHHDILLCRSTLKVDKHLLKSHPLHAVATASSGTCHIDKHFLQERNITLIDAKGSNAQSVADYVLACIASLDKENLILGRNVGIIGVGAVGTCVSERLEEFSVKQTLYDPPRALRDPLFKSATLNMLHDVDLLCIHAELHHGPLYPSFNLLDSQFFKQLKPGCVIINASRGGIVNEEDLLNTHGLIYCTDVYLNEPNPNPCIIDKAQICTPHIAGHSIEAKRRALTLVSEKIHQLYQLQAPKWTQASKLINGSFLNHNSWQEFILSIYNPCIETQQLKSNPEKQDAFLSLRTAHNKRHDFSCFEDLITDTQFRKLLSSK